MNVQDLLFYFDAALIVGCALFAVTLRHLLHAALALMMSLFCTAGLFVLLQAEFAALVQIMVYIGGVVIFIVYTILLTAHLGEDLPRSSVSQRLGAAALALLSAAALLFVLWKTKADAIPLDHVAPGENPGGIYAIGRRLLSYASNGFVIPFEIISLLLLAALVGAVSIARRPTAREEAQ